MIKQKIKHDKSSIFYLLPTIIVISFIYANPIVRMFWSSIIKWDGLKETTNFNAITNFKDAILNRYFFQVLLNNLTIVAIIIPIIVLFGLFCAQFIYLKVFGYRIYQYLFFLPVIMPNAVVGIVWTFFLHKSGPLNTLFTKMGLDFLVVNWFGNPRFSLFGIIITVIWQGVGFAIVLFLARLSTVDPSLYDAAKVDGASDLQTIRYVTIPQLKSVIQLYVVLETISLLNFMFSYIYVMTGGGPGYSSTVMEYFIYTFSFIFTKIGPANAVAVILFVITSVFVLLYFKLSKTAEEIDN